MHRETHISLIENDIRANAQQLAAKIYEKGYRKEINTEFVLDTEFESKQKVRYYCRKCGYWQVAKKQNAQNLLRSLHYCSFCGARFVAKEDKQ